MVIIILIIIAIVIWIIKGQGYDAARLRNSFVSWAAGEEGFCRECKYCIKDSNSFTGHRCSIGKCENITDTTRMDCFEKPTVNENDLQELFSMGIWTYEGQQYIRNSILGKKMTFSELDEFLKEIPKKYPYYINPNFKNDYDN